MSLLWHIEIRHDASYHTSVDREERETERKEKDTKKNVKESKKEEASEGEEEWPIRVSNLV